MWATGSSCTVIPGFLACAVGAQLQELYRESLSNAGTGYMLADELNATGIGQVGATVPGGMV